MTTEGRLEALEKRLAQLERRQQELAEALNHEFRDMTPLEAAFHRMREETRKAKS